MNPPGLDLTFPEPTVALRHVPVGPSPPAAIAGVRIRIQDENESKPFVPETAIDLAIQNAVRDYSRSTPHVVVADLDGAGLPYFDLTAIEDWVTGFSSVREVEFPALDAPDESNWPSLLDPQRDWREYQTATTTYLHMLNSAPDAGEVVRVVLTTPHVLGGDVNTIPVQDYSAVLDLAASYACLVAASRSAASHDGQIRSTGVRYGDAQSRWLEAAKYWEGRYRAHVGLGSGSIGTSPAATGGDAPAASAIFDWDGVPGFDGTYLTHERRRRSNLSG